MVFSECWLTAFKFAYFIESTLLLLFFFCAKNEGGCMLLLLLKKGEKSSGWCAITIANCCWCFWCTDIYWCCRCCYYMVALQCYCSTTLSHERCRAKAFSVRMHGRVKGRKWEWEWEREQAAKRSIAHRHKAGKTAAQVKDRTWYVHFASTIFHHFLK